jgi:hypothetical protein
MKRLAAVLRGFGFAWLGLCALAYVVGTAAFIWQKGLFTWWNASDPFSPMQLIGKLIIISPGIGLVVLAEKLKAKSS